MDGPSRKETGGLAIDSVVRGSVQKKVPGDGERAVERQR